MAQVTVHQLQSKDGGDAYLNIDEDYGRIEVMGYIYKCPVYFARNGSYFYLFVFDDQRYASEWLEENNNKYELIVELRPTE